MARAPVLQLEGVCCSFARGRERVSVLRDVSLEVPAGGIATVLGGPGQGKTTLMRVACGTLAIDAGSVTVDGQRLAGISERELTRLLARDVAVARRYGPDARMTVEDYLMNSLSATREGSWKSRRATLARTLGEFDLAGARELRWRALSDSQRASLELAAAMIRDPKLLLVDDVLVELGWAAKQQALELIEGFALDRGGAVLMAVSDQAAGTRGSQVYQLAEGKLRLMHKDPEVVHLDRRGARG